MSPERWRQIEELYHAALELDTGRRASFLAQACQGDEELHREVESLLAQEGVSLPDLETRDMLAPGTRVGAYRIEAAVGQGGMGVVYRALDSKLNRQVALKFLSDELADATARRRFQREAQMASSLNHPHIVTVHDTGEFEDRQYLVTEFVDGGTLYDWVRSEQRTWQQIVELLVGVADALATAHDAGILHRDIKPANILVTKSGYAKLADFGLAKLAPDSRRATTQTLTAEKTRPGIVVGTIAYMSPEQASGRPTDSRSDIFSFGVVLYELIAGRRPFVGATDLELLQRIVHGAAVPLGPDVVPGLRMVLEKALEKDPAERYQSIRELVVDLRRLSRQSGESMPAEIGRRRTPLRWATLAAVVLVAVITGGALVYLQFRQASPARLEYTQLTNFADSAVSPALSPDGRMLSFIRSEDDHWGFGEVYVKLLPDGEPVQLSHDGQRKAGPAVFSPDGARIAYTVAVERDWDTWAVPVLGGKPSRMLANAQGLTWIGTEGSLRRVMFSEWTGEGPHMALFTSRENRADARRIYFPPDKNGMVHRAFLSPDRKSVLLVEMGMNGWIPCRLIPFDGSSLGTQVGPAPAQCTNAAWSPDGKWMYFSANNGSGFHIWRQHYPDGSPEQVTTGATDEQGIAFAPDGRSFVTSVGSSQSTLWVHDSRGERQVTAQGYAYMPSFSYDETRLFYLYVVSSNESQSNVPGELWVADLETGQRERVLPDFLIQQYDVAPDGKRVVFVSPDKGSRSTVWIALLDGRSAPHRLASMDSLTSFFGANDDVFFVGGEGDTKFLHRIKEDGHGFEQVLPEPIRLLYDVSPDGNWVTVWKGSSIIMYASDGGSRTVICSTCGHRGPGVSWSRNGKFAYFSDATSQQTYAVPLKAGQVMPTLPSAGLNSAAEAAKLPGARLISQQGATPASNPSDYAFSHVTTHRNIYRIPVP